VLAPGRVLVLVRGPLALVLALAPVRVLVLVRQHHNPRPLLQQRMMATSTA
jgi:hypothetical protein